MGFIDITRSLGLTSVIISVGFLLHLNHYEKMARKMVEGPSGFIMGGVLPVLVGSLIVNLPYQYIHGWEFLLPIVGGILLLFGIFRIWCVHIWMRIARKNIAFLPVLFVVFGLIFGCLLCYVGYVVPAYHY